MHLNNHPDLSSIRRTKTIVLFSDGDTEIKIKLQDLSPTYGDRLEAEIPTPQPPVKGPLRDDRNRLVRDPENGRVVLEYGESNPAYRKAVAEHSTLSLVFMLIEGVVPGQLAFEAEKDPDDPGGYYGAVLKELELFGFGLSQVSRIATAVRELSSINQDDLEEARQDF